MAALLIAIVAVGVALALVTAARQALLAKAEPPAQPCCGCAPCHHTCQRKAAA